MRCIVLLCMLAMTTLGIAQDTGSIVGKLTDKEMNNEPLAFANVLIKGTTKGTTSDFDGLYELADVEPGNYTLEFSFLGYETVDIPVEIVAGKVTTVNVPMGASEGMALDEVVVTTTARKDSEVALLLEQKKAIEIKESIGAQELRKIGVSDAAAATTKISGVAASETSGDVFVRGLGDRYLSTTMNGLPIPSDDVENKNIDLELFPTRVIQNVSISKTYAAQGTADMSSGTINVKSRELSGSQELSVSAGGGINTNVAASGVWDNFRVSPNMDDTNFGIYKSDVATQNQILGQTWNTQKQDFPMDYGISVSAGKKFLENKLALFVSASHARSFDYREGLFRQFRSNFIDDTITDATQYDMKIVNSVLADVTYNLNENNKLKYNFFMINKLNEQVFEGGRNGEATIFEETAPAEGLFQFIRDQNTKQTKLYVNQLMGTHRFGEKNTLTWAGAYNFLEAQEPNRIRNEVNFDPEGDSPTIGSGVQLGRNGGFQQRKSRQDIEDEEFAGYIKDAIQFVDEEEKTMKLEVGANYRFKTRDFESEFVGVEETSTNAVLAPSIDDLGSIFILENFQGTDPNLEFNFLGQNANGERTDIYDGELTSYAGFADFNYGFGKWNVNVGARYQKDKIEVNYDIGNLFPRTGQSLQEYDNLYPSVNIKYSVNEQHALRVAFSKTITLPEFKEISPFEYVSPTGQITRGNPDLIASNNYNYDLKWEYFPSAGQLISAAAFYKSIKDPINKVRDRGSAGVFSYFNSGEEATVFGLEAEARLDIIKPIENDEDGSLSGYGLDVVLNATRMWHNQDLKVVTNEAGQVIRSFRYKNLTETDLQGASDWIFNSTVNFRTAQETPFTASLTANYASDKIFALGVPTDQTNSDIFYDDAIIEQGFVVLDAVLGKQLNDHWSIRFVAKNLLNPEIEMTQMIGTRNNDTGAFSEREETVLSYDLGIDFNIGVSFKF